MLGRGVSTCESFNRKLTAAKAKLKQLRNMFVVLAAEPGRPGTAPRY
jgi:hypothetical protein